MPGGPADDAGLRAGSDTERFQARTVKDGGDIIAAVDGRRLDDADALGVELLRHRPGDTVTLRVFRDGRPRDVRVKLGERPLQTDAGSRP